MNIFEPDSLTGGINIDPTARMALTLGGNLLAGSAPSPVPRSFGSILGPSIMNTMGAVDAAAQQGLQRKLTAMQVQQMQQKMDFINSILHPPGATTSSNSSQSAPSAPMAYQQTPENAQAYSSQMSPSPVGGVLGGQGSVLGKINPTDLAGMMMGVIPGNIIASQLPKPTPLAGALGELHGYAPGSPEAQATQNYIEQITGQQPQSDIGKLEQDRAKYAQQYGENSSIVQAMDKRIAIAQGGMTDAERASNNRANTQTYFDTGMNPNGPPTQTAPTPQTTTIGANTEANKIPIPKGMTPKDQAAYVARVIAEKPTATTSYGNSVNGLDRLAQLAQEIKDDKALSRITGFYGAVPNMPGSDAANLQAKLDSLKSQTAFSVLQNMREGSKTGGALGQVSNFEEQMLQNNLAALDTKQSPQAFARNLQKIIDYTLAAKKRLSDAYKMTYGDAPAVTSGWKIIE